MPQGQTGASGSDGGFNFTAGSTQNNPFMNGTPPPTTFGQNGGAGFGGNTGVSFGSSFGGNNNAHQAPQQNGFNPQSNSSIFSGLNNTANNNTSFGGFGQSTQNTQPQQNGITPSTATTATFGSFTKPSNDSNGNVFKNFQLAPTPQQSQSTPATSFGAGISQQPNGDKTPTTPSLGSFGVQQTGNKSSLFASTSEAPEPSRSLFTTETPKPSTNFFTGGSLGQLNGASKPDETPKTNTSSLFSNLQQNGATKGLFGASTTLPDQRPTTPGGSVLTGLNSTRASTIKTGMFTQNTTSETPKTNLFSFGQQGGDGADERPKASGNFSSAAKTNGTTSNLFGGISNITQQTPAKQTSNLFSSTFSQPPQQSGSAPAPAFNFGQSTQGQQDTSMTTPGSTPQKSSSNIFAQSQPLSQQPANEQPAAPTETPAGQGKSLFDRISRDESPATAQKPTFTPSTSMFTAANNKENARPTSKNLFEQTSSAQQQTLYAPSTPLFSKPASQVSQTPSAAPWLSHATATPAVPTTSITPATPQPPTTATKAAAANGSMSERVSESEKQTFQLLNEGLMKHLTTQDPNVDWTTIMQYYLQQAAKIRNKPEPKFDAPTAAQPASTQPPPSALLREQPLTIKQFTGSLQTAKPSMPSMGTNIFSSASTPKAPASTTSNLFAAAQTPKQSTFNAQPSNPPATAPVNRKRPGPFTEDDDDEEPERGPATEKRARHNEPIDYPKLPENSSSSSKLIESIINTPKAQGSSEQPAASSFSASGFKPFVSATSTTDMGSQPPKSSSGFKPAVPPPTASGLPKFSPTAGKAGGFLAAFGKAASSEAEKAKRKRMDEDYDSDEETEEEWKKKDEQSQAAKRAKLVNDGKKASGFMFNAAAAKTTGVAASMFGHMSQTPSEASDNEIEDDKADAEKAQGTGDNTWKLKTPIKFGASTAAKESTTPAAPPPSFGNLFGATPATGGSSLLNVPGATKPSINFNFASNPASSTGTSRASTPGVTTDGENSTAGNDDDDNDSQSGEPQVEDQTGLRPEESEAEDVLFNCSTATAKKVKYKKDPDAPTGQTRVWTVVGVGHLYVLKNKDTGKVRVLLKVPPYGTAKVNFPPMAKMNYDVTGKKGQMVQGAFLDHIDQPKAPGMGIYALDVGVDKAPELARILNANRPAEKAKEGQASQE